MFLSGAAFIVSLILVMLPQPAAAAEPVSSTATIRFGDDLRTGDIRLSGPGDSRRIGFACEAGWKVLPASELHLFVEHSPELDPDRSFLSITLNGGILRSLRLDETNQALTDIAIPLQAIYSASKHAQLAFSRSTAALLRGSGIDVHTVLPGFVETEGFPQRAKLRSRLLRRFVIEPEDVARAIVEAVEKGKPEVTVPWFPYRLATIGQALVPRLFSRLVASNAGRHRDE